MIMIMIIMSVINGRRSSSTLDCTHRICCRPPSAVNNRPTVVAVCIAFADGQRAVA